MVNASCAFVVDGVYHLGDERFTKTVGESRPTGQTVTSMEMDAALTPEGKLALTCTTRTRTIDLRWSVTKTYEYRGGYEPAAYMGLAVLDGLLGAVTSGVILAACLDDENDLSCYHTLWGAPFGLGMAWAIIRWAGANPPKLVNKESTSSQAMIGDVIESTKVDCPVTQIYAGTTSGHGREEEIAGTATSEARTLADDAVPLTLEPDWTTRANKDALNMLANRYGAELWFIDPVDGVTRVNFDRCELLRRNIDQFETTEQEKVRTACPLSPPPTTQPR